MPDRQSQDVFYVVTNARKTRLKLGITTGPLRGRLQSHALDGYTVVARYLTDLALGEAPRLEKTVLASLQRSGVRPIRGMEYFHGRDLATVLKIVDQHEPSLALGTRIPLPLAERPKYQQVAHHLRAEIYAGKIPPGPLPTLQEIAKRWGGSDPTVAKAVGLLAEEGLVVVGGRGHSTIVLNPNERRGGQ